LVNELISMRKKTKTNGNSFSAACQCFKATKSFKSSEFENMRFFKSVLIWCASLDETRKTHIFRISDIPTHLFHFILFLVNLVILFFQF
jgi:uncharacterized protein with PQ loop repeat